VEGAVALMKERVTFLPDFVEQGYYLFEGVRQYDDETLQKKWSAQAAENFTALIPVVEAQEPFEAQPLEEAVKAFMQERGIKPGDLLPLLRIALAGTMKGPAVFDMAALLGREEMVQRLRALMQHAG
jgi:glutamyl/glutaminyl-tRNA synthetase